MLRHINPQTMMSPYSVNTHAIEVPSGHRVLFMSGQVGQTIDGEIPDDAAAQTRLVWENLKTVLAAADMGLENLVHVNSYLTERDDLETFLEVREPYMLIGKPTATLVLVSGLADPNWRIEVEGYAVKRE